MQPRTAGSTWTRSSSTARSRSARRRPGTPARAAGPAERGRMLKPEPTLRIERRPRKLRFEGRVLFLTEDPELIRRQLQGEDLDWDPAMKLRDNISTDEITPGWVCYNYDEKLGEY